MSDFDFEDERPLCDVPPDEPAGFIPVSFNVPIPHEEQITAEIARQTLARYNNRNFCNKIATEKLEAMIDEKLSSIVMPVIEALLQKPLQPTDAFDNPRGEPTTLQGILLDAVTGWASVPVNREGKPSKDTYTTRTSRLEHFVGECVNRELDSLIREEVRKLQAQFKAAATKRIAEQIAAQVASIVMK